MRFRLVILLLTTFLVVSQSFSQSKKDAEVIAVAKKMLEAQQNYDSGTLDKIYASDYIEISPKGEIDEREKAVGFYKVVDPEAARAKTPTYILDDFNVRHYGKFAFVISKLSFAFKNQPATPPATAGRVTFALRKEKGSWKIYSAQFTPIPPPRPTQQKTKSN